MLKLALLFSIILCYNSLNAQELEQKEWYPIIQELDVELQKKGVAPFWIMRELKENQGIIYPEIQDRFQKMAEIQVNKKQMSIDSYEKIFINEQKYAIAVEFVKKYKDILNSLELKNGIPSALLVAILGIESQYANPDKAGKYLTLNSLVSQYVFMPARRKFSLQEIASFYQVTKKLNQKSNYFKGSYAGAMGYAQFIPTSILNYFISFDNTRIPDIYSVEDSLASIENYLFSHGLNGNNINNEKKLYQTIFSYNRSDIYVKTVLKLFQIIKNINEN